MKLSAFFATVVLCQISLGCSVYSPDLLGSDAKPTTSSPTGEPAGGSSGGGNPPVNVEPDAGMDPDQPSEPPDGGTGGSGGTNPSDGDSGVPSVGGSGGSTSMHADGGGVGGGSGGAPTLRDPALVDDFEDRNISLLPRGERVGYWFADGQKDDGTITPLAITALMPPREDSKYGIHVVASGYTADPTWAALGVNFNFDSDSKTPLAYAGAGEYTGIRFWAKHGGSAESDTVRVELPTTDTSSAAPYLGDDDNYGVLVTLQPEWTRHTILWDDSAFAQGGWGARKDFIAEHVTSIQFKLNSPPDKGFDLWLDDIEFVK